MGFDALSLAVCPFSQKCFYGLFVIFVLKCVDWFCVSRVLFILFIFRVLITCVEMVFFIHMYWKSVFANWLVLHCCGLQCGSLCVFSREVSHLHAYLYK